MKMITPLFSTFPLVLSCLLFSSFNTANSLLVTSIPPLLDVPTFSLATLGGRPHDDCETARDGDGEASNVSTMNILTYATPVSVRPERVWSIGLYKGTLSHENFARRRRGVLQLLRPQHVTGTGELVKVLGGSSGRDVDKAARCAELGFTWRKLACAPSADLQDNVPVGDPPGASGGAGESNVCGAEQEIDEWPLVLPSCLYYLKVELIGDLIDCGTHDVALCRVVSMIADDDVQVASEELDYLSTRRLRELGVISEIGRVVQLEE